MTPCFTADSYSVICSFRSFRSSYITHYREGWYREFVNWPIARVQDSW